MSVTLHFTWEAGTYAFALIACFLAACIAVEEIGDAPYSRKQNVAGVITCLFVVLSFVCMIGFIGSMLS